MSISHWGIFPGWYEAACEVGAGYRIGGGSFTVYRPVDWHQFCLATDPL